MLAGDLKDHLEAFQEGAEDLLPEDELVRKLERALREHRPLRIKQGFDPTAPDLHLGHVIGLRKLRQLQELGHTVVVIVGDYTAQVGDPSGRSKTRPQLSPQEVEANARTYLEQFFRIVDRDATELRRNGEWFSQMTFSEILQLTSKYTVARLLERDDFAKRFKANQPIGVHELLYPIMQGWDSVEVRADVEIGGTEQKFNLLVGRALQEASGQEPQVILTLPILVGLDGEQRMSKSLGNYVGITEPPSEQFGKVMSIADPLLEPYWRLASGVRREEQEAVIGELRERRLHPMEAKKMLAEQIVRSFHGDEAAAHARRTFEEQFSERGVPSEMYEWRVPVATEQPLVGIKDVLVACGLARSGSDAWRKVDEGAVEVDGETIRDRAARIDLSPGKSHLVRLGRRWAKVLGEIGAKTPVKSSAPVPIWAPRKG